MHRALVGLFSAPRGSGGGGGGVVKTGRKDRCRVGLRARLNRQPHRSPFLSNVRSVVHNMNEMELLVVCNKSIRDCCVLLISETWLHPDAPLQLAGRTLHCLDRSKDSGKSRGGLPRC